MYLVDSHCHLNELDYKNLHKSIDSVLENAINNQVGFLLTVATTLPGYLDMHQKIGIRHNVAFSCGVHPLYLKNKYYYDELIQFAKAPEVVAIGETGLDYFYQKQNISLQKESFRQHIRIGRKLHKPIIVHSRNANQDTLNILIEEQANKCGVVLHCFTEDKDTARKLLDIGCYISFSGIITFRNAEELRKVVRYVPMDRILIETDSPYLAPVPHRGKENQPSYILEIAIYLAALKGMTLDYIAQQTTDNFIRLFQLNLPNYS
ncbi:YchF/TatD family DNA exonuclease [Candidatus Profftia sp. (ex Adelges kitamiensis)]|uniref:YchF/TatD family DNA exonuclease n=1 Tax=Candidatus Profftia sp. (ex Adelges kitamiensis) TaxID=2864218 RepID=UPI001CE2A461|nr:YchF/TatD family DNA exonuclease [Candidatus Profftia sp. (ex Adelges kitamiensis)]